MKIIAVDDEKLALDTLVDSIEKAVPDASITGFRKPDDALQCIRENDCEIAFLDIKMRGMTGLELAKRLKEIKAQRMYFAYDTPDDYEPLVEAGKILRAEGHRPESHSMGCYCLIGHPKDTFAEAEKRLTDIARNGFVPYAMLYRGDDGSMDKEWRKFQREWCRPAIVGAKMREYWKGEKNET